MASTNRDPHQVWFFQVSTGAGVREVGPLSDAQLRLAAVEKKLARTSLVRSPTATKNRWIHAESVRGLFPQTQFGVGSGEKGRPKTVEQDYQTRESESSSHGVRSSISENHRPENQLPPPAPHGSHPPPLPNPTSNEMVPVAIALQPRPMVPAGTGFGLHAQRVLVILLSIIGAAGTMLPWVWLPIVGSVNGLFWRQPKGAIADFVMWFSKGQFGDGWLVLPLFLMTFAISLTPNVDERIGGVRSFIGAIMAIGAGAIGAFKLYQVATIFPASDETPAAVPIRQMLDASIQPGIGLYTIVGSAFFIACVLFAFPGNRLR